MTTPDQQRALREQRALELIALLTTHPRHVGSPGNQRVAELLAARLESAGWAVEQQEFPCDEWIDLGSDLSVGELTWTLRTGPYGRPAAGNAIVTVAETVGDLDRSRLAGTIVLVRGDLATTPLMPKSFEFYNPEEHRELVARLEHTGALAIITATGAHPELAGGRSPFPVVEDGEFDIATAYVDEPTGEEIAAHVGREARVAIRCRATPTRGANVVARRGRAPFTVATAHFDAALGTPGALDNAAGVAVLSDVAEQITHAPATGGIEIGLLNGEDHWSIPGQRRYLATLDPTAVRLAVNVDGVARRDDVVAWSAFNLGDLDRPLRAVLDDAPGCVAGPPWFSGDHSMFLAAHRPTVALTSLSFLDDPTSTVTHTVADDIAIVDPVQIVTVSDLVQALISAAPHPSPSTH